MLPMKRFLLLIFMLLSFQLQAQLAIKVLHFNPTGDQGLLFEKRFTGELMYMGELIEDNNYIRFRAGTSIVPLKSRLDTFPSYILENGEVKPGYKIYEQYDMGFFFGGMEWACIHPEPFYAYFGGDIILGGILVNSKTHYESTYAEEADDSFKGGHPMFGFRYRAGVQYKFFKEHGVFAEFSQAFYGVFHANHGVMEKGVQSHYDIGVGIQFVFD